MNKKLLFPLLLITVFISALGITLWALPRVPEFERALLQRITNRYTQEFFAGSVRIGKMALDHHLKIRVSDITARLQARQGPVPLEIDFLESQDSLGAMLFQKPVRFDFKGGRPQGSSRQGVSGSFTVQTGPTPSFDLTADFGNTDLEDWQWLDPQNLGGATGAMKGGLTFRQATGREPEFSMNLEAPQPGGNIQAKFFDLFLPYLPTALQKEKVKKISKNQKLVRYQTASLEVSLPKSDRLKILLRIFIPDYNLKLTLNADIRTDAKDAFSQIARIMGFIEVK